MLLITKSLSKNLEKKKTFVGNVFSELFNIGLYEATLNIIDLIAMKFWHKKEENAIGADNHALKDKAIYLGVIVLSLFSGWWEGLELLSGWRRDVRNAPIATMRSMSVRLTGSSLHIAAITLLGTYLYPVFYHLLKLTGCFVTSLFVLCALAHQYLFDSCENNVGTLYFFVVFLKSTLYKRSLSWYVHAVP